MELGGKSPNVILDDADLARAVPDGVAKCFLNSGQTCSALTRMLVPARASSPRPRRSPPRRAEAFTPGDPFDESTRLGPLVSDVQRERVRGYIEKGEAEGAKLRHRRRRGARGPRPRLLRPPDRLLRGDAGDDDRPGGDLRPGAGDPALRRRGGRRCGSPTTAPTASPAASGPATRSARSRSPSGIRTGQIEINGGAFNPLAPFGGYGQSGHGRENGRYGLEEMLQVKSLQL